MNALDYLNGPKPMSAGTQMRLQMRRLRSEIAATNGPVRDALIGELAVLQGESSAKAAGRLASHAEKVRSPHAGAMRRAATAAQASLSSVKARVAALLGFSPTAPTPSPTPAPAPTPAPSTPPVRAAGLSDDPWRRVTADSTPEAVEAAMQDLCGSFPARALGHGWERDPKTAAKVMGRIDVIVRFLGEVAQIDPSGKIIERVAAGAPAERKEAARIVGGILHRIANS
ncbi:MAG: hypothetical protein U1G08_18865 [Verrucomicrobiota bacterium]